MLNAEKLEAAPEVRGTRLRAAGKPASVRTASLTVSGNEAQHILI